MFERLPELVNHDAGLRHRGRHVSTTFLAEAGERAWLVEIHKGEIVSVREGPFVMPRWAFALRADEGTWRRFWQPVPPPGSHDIMALIKFRTLRAEGDLYPLMANLLWFKSVLAAPRSLHPAATATTEEHSA
jgi:hypothetical protein